MSVMVAQTAFENGDLAQFLKTATNYLASGVEASAAVLIVIACIEATIGWVTFFVRRTLPPEGREMVRLRLGRWLALALEFELAADILRTAAAPTVSDIAQLAAIAAIRTALNFFLQREIDRSAERQNLPPTERM